MMILDIDVTDQDGIELRLESAVPDANNPLMDPAFPWDSGVVFSHGTFLRDPNRRPLEVLVHRHPDGRAGLPVIPVADRLDL